MLLHELSRLWPLFWPAITFLIATLIALAIRGALLGSLRRWPPGDSIALMTSAVRGPSFLWCVALGLYVANEVAVDAQLLPAHWHARIAVVLEALIVLSITVMLAGLSGRLMAGLSERSALGAGVTGLAQTTSRVLVFVLGFLVVLSLVGIQITPVLTALGVGGVAVALALQDTLANLFAGVHIIVDRPIRVGDYVKVGDAGEGSVTDIGWRSTRLKTLGNSVLTIPNQTVAKAPIMNYSLPDARISLGLKVSVDPAADVDHVESVLQDEVARAVDIRGLLRDPPPSLSLIPGFGESSLEWSVGYAVASFPDQYAVQDELRRRILRRFRREGIALAVPVRNVRIRRVGPTHNGGPPGPRANAEGIARPDGTQIAAEPAPRTGASGAEGARAPNAGGSPNAGGRPNAGGSP